MPNLTDQARPMITFFQHPVLKTDAEWVDGQINYIAHGGAYDFQK